jgi:hypothetical protein
MRSAHSTRNGLRRMANRPRVIITSRFWRPSSLATERTHARITTIFRTQPKLSVLTITNSRRIREVSTDSTPAAIASI